MKTMITNPSHIQWEQEPNGTYRAVVYRNTEPVYQLSMEAVLMADRNKHPEELLTYMDAEGFAIEHPTAADFTELHEAIPSVTAWLHETQADLQTLQAIYPIGHPAGTDLEPDNIPYEQRQTHMITIGMSEANAPDLIAAQSIFEDMFGTVCDALHIGLLEDFNYCAETALQEGHRLMQLNTQAYEHDQHCTTPDCLTPHGQFSVMADVTDATQEEIQAAEYVLRNAPHTINETATLMATRQH